MIKYHGSLNDEKTAGLNSYHPLLQNSYTAKEKTVYECIRHTPEGVGPKLISKWTGILHSTVRGICKKLLVLGHIRRSIKGLYCVPEGIHDLSTEEPRFENIFLVCPVSNTKILTEEEILEYIGVELRLTYGRTNNQISCRILSKERKGLLFSEFHLLVELFKEHIKSKLGITILDTEILVRNIECNVDMIKYRLEGIQALTIQLYTGEMLKFYNKENPDRLRIEVREVEEIPYIQLIDRFFQLNETRGYLDEFRKDINEMKKALGATNSTNYNLTVEMSRLKRSNEELHKTVQKLWNILTKFEKYTLSDIEKNAKALTSGGVIN